MSDTNFLSGIPAKTHAVSFSGIVLDDVIPAVHNVSGKGVLVVEGILCTHAEVIVRNRIRKEQTARVIPVVFRLNDLGAGGGYEFSKINLQALSCRCQIGEVSLLQILIERQPSWIGSVDGIDCLAVAQRNVIAGPAVGHFGSFVHYQLH